jgi:aspartate/methionine/tyrosine aminotransferase
MRAAEAVGRPLLDLTESNPTRVGLPYPPQGLDALADPRAARYEPHPLGMAIAREAVARDAERRGARVDPGRVVLSASTSEAYAWIFTLLCDPGDAVLVPRPSYPLFEYLARVACVELVYYDLDFHGRWDVELASVDAAPPTTKAVVLVSPNNPTGSYITRAELDAIGERCVRRGWALVVDEVFADYALDVEPEVTDLATTAPVLTFSLGGASKTLGLPQLKLGWTVVGGPEDDCREAIDRLEVIADTFLSVSTPVQVATPRLMSEGIATRLAIRDRLRTNLGRARELVGGYPSCDLLPTEGGWSAVVRVPALRSEEALVVALVERAGVLAHPGYYYDFGREAFLVVSLLPEPAVFAEGLGRALQLASTT